MYIGPLQNLIPSTTVQLQSNVDHPSVLPSSKSSIKSFAGFDTFYAN